MTNITPIERISSLDLLRGIAILGILFMNIVGFAMPEVAYMNVNWHGVATETDKLSFALQYFFAKERFIALFCVLFGAGMVVFWQRAQAKYFEPIALLRKRMAWLLLFGILHLTFLFYGDILILYATCAFLIIKSVPNDDEKLMRRGIIYTAIGMVIFMCLAALMLLELDVNSGKSMLGYPYTVEEANDLINSAVGSYGNMISYNLKTGWGVLVAWAIYFFTISGPMLIGMSLIKKGFFKKGFSLRTELMLILVGSVMSASQLYMIMNTDFTVDFWLIAPFNTIGGLLVILFVSSRIVKAVSKKSHWLMPLQHVGRMAFSLYIFQSITMTLLFRVILADHFGQWHLGELMAIAAVTSIVQIILASWWQGKIGQGPLEKLWRKLIYRNVHPIT